MTPIDSAGRLAAVIRRQVSSLSKASGAGSATGGVRAGSKQNAEVADSAGTLRDVASLVARRVQAIDPHDPNRQHKAFRVFLESVLLAEFGESLVNDAGFHQLVDEVHCEMDADAELAEAIKEATSVMLANAGSAKRP
jgi:hypothetical protein